MYYFKLNENMVIFIKPECERCIFFINFLDGYLIDITTSPPSPSPPFFLLFLIEPKSKQ
jgi:hypothetical protein